MPKRIYNSLVAEYNAWDGGTKARFWVGVFVVICSIVVMIIVIRSVKQIEYDTNKAEAYKEQAETYRKSVTILIDQVNSITTQLQTNKQRDSAIISRSMDAITRIQHIDEGIKTINQKYEKSTDFSSLTDDELDRYIAAEAADIRSSK